MIDPCSALVEYAADESRRELMMSVERLASRRLTPAAGAESTRTTRAAESDDLLTAVCTPSPGPRLLVIGFDEHESVAAVHSADFQGGTQG